MCHWRFTWTDQSLRFPEKKYRQYRQWLLLPSNSHFSLPNFSFLASSAMSFLKVSLCIPNWITTKYAYNFSNCIYLFLENNLPTKTFPVKHRQMILQGLNVYLFLEVSPIPVAINNLPPSWCWKGISFKMVRL